MVDTVVVVGCAHKAPARVKLDEQQHECMINTHSYEVTLLENGMIFEHIDMKQEEREECKRKRREGERYTHKSFRRLGINTKIVVIVCS